jgi:predicted amidohydrolase YtcJ
VTQDVDVTPFTTSTFQEAIGKIQAALGAAAPGAWVPAFGYDPSLIQGPAQITRADLDPISPNNPVFILNLSGHLAYANSKALEAAGVTNQTTDPAGGGRFLRDATGQLTGVIEEVPAINRFVPLLPKPSATELAGLVAGVLHKAAAAGCTTLNDAGLGTTLGTAEVDTLREILQSTNSPVRMTAFLAGLLFDEWKKLSWFTPGAGDERFRAVKIKYWADGSTQGYTAALEQPYLNSTGTGFLNYSSDQLQTAVSEAVGDGWPVAIHCNGDAAVEQALGIFERIVSDSPKTGHHRIEHCSLASQDQLERIKRLGVSPTFLMNHVYYWGRVFRDEILGPERAAALDPVNSCLKLGLSFSLHSDSFTTPIAPLTYVQTAVTRIMRDGGEVLGPDERIGVAEALKAVTIYPAGQLGIDALTGSLEIGKYADLALLDQDPSVADPNAIGAIRVLETWLGGERRYSAAG